MIPFVSPLFGGKAPVASVVASITTGDGATTSTGTLSGYGAMAGHLACVYGSYGNSPTAAGGGTWNAISVDSGAQPLYWKLLTAADVAGAITSSRPFSVLIFRNAVDLASRPVSGFTKAANHAGLLAAIFSLGSGDYDRFTSPTGFAETPYLLFTYGSGYVRTLMQHRVGDALPPYVDGAAFGRTSNLDTSAIICELRS